MCKCSEVFDNKFVQCFDQQEIAMYIKSNGTVKLVHGEVIEMTNFDFCPYCGRNLKPILLNPTDIGGGAMVSAKIRQLVPNIPNELTEIQNAIQRQLQEQMLLKDTTIEEGFANSGLSNLMRGGS